MIDGARSPFLLVSIPGLHARDLGGMPHLARLMGQGGQAELVPSFPAVTCPVQANMTTGGLPHEHGVVANGFFWRERQELEMWTAGNDCIERPQIWDRLHEFDPSIRSAVWFAMHSKGCGADYICTPAPIHHPDGSESLWCYTRPDGLYEQLVEAEGHFPLQHFWGPLANIQSTDWIVKSAIRAAAEFRPDFFHIYVPHLDYAAQKSGPGSDSARAACQELDVQLHNLTVGMEEAYGPRRPVWVVASEYAIVDVNHVCYPNRLLRAAGWLSIDEGADGELLDVTASPAWALTDHQHAHVFVRDRHPQIVSQVVQVFRGQPGIAEVLAGDDLSRYGLQHARCGDVVLVSEPNSWMAYYWWLDDGRAPPFARSVDIHRKPGYDPVELFFDPRTKSIPLDATLVQGSHGAPAVDPSQRGVVLTSQPDLLRQESMADTGIAPLVLRHFATG